MNIGRYPAYSIAVKREVLLDKKVRFSPLFGGGAKYSNGEDSLFLKDAFKGKIAMYATDVHIGEEIPGESTWFEGYTEKFFHDRGVLFAFLYGKNAWLWRLRFIAEGAPDRYGALIMSGIIAHIGFQLVMNIFEQIAREIAARFPFISLVVELEDSDWRRCV